MKQIFFITLLTLLTVSFAKAQTSEVISELKPIPSNIGKFSGIVPNRKLKFTAKIEFVNLSGDKKGISVTVQVPYREIIFANLGGNTTARINFFGRITSKDKKNDGFFEERLEAVTKPEVLADKTNKETVDLRKVFELPAGKYQIGIIVRDTIWETSGIKVIKFQIDATN